MRTTLPGLARTRIRNVGILAHVDAGKTTVTERILHATGAIHRTGEVHDGSTVTDFDPQERDRGITIFAAAVSCTWREHRIDLIDTPGHVDFSAEVERSLRVLDGAVVVFDAVAGVEPQTESVWRRAEHHGVPRIAFVNKLDRAGADLDAAVGSIRTRLGTQPLVVQLPVGQEAGFDGLVDLVTLDAWSWADGTARPLALPESVASQAVQRRALLAEQVAERDPTVLEEFCAGEVSAATLAAGLRRVTLDGTGTVVLCGSAYRGRGIELLLDAVLAYLPAPPDRPAVPGQWDGRAQQRPADPAAPFAALAFKVTESRSGRLTFLRIYSGTIEKGTGVLDTTTGRRERIGRILRVRADRHTDLDSASAGDIVAVVGLKATGTGATLCDPAAPLVLERAAFPEPVISVAVEAAGAGLGERLHQALARLAGEDPTLRVRTDGRTGQTLLSGLGELHLQVAVERIRSGHGGQPGIEVVTGPPRVSYRERLAGTASGVQYRHVKQDGGPGQFAVVVFDVEPLPDRHLQGPAGESPGERFVSTVTGGRVPAEFVRAFEAGCREALAEGPLGHPVTGVLVRLRDGQTHPKDSSEVAFRAAGRFGLRQALRQCGTQLLEPVAEVTVSVPADLVGTVLGDLGARRGRVSGSTPRGDAMVVTAVVPLAELTGYATALRSRTGGRGEFSARPAGYQPA